MGEGSSWGELNLKENWNALLASLPGAHVLQTWEWGQVKARFGWEPHYQIWRDEKDRVVAAALILQRSLSLGGLGTPMRVLYVPKGPVLDWSNQLLRQRVLIDLSSLAQRKGAIFIKIDPDVRLGTGFPGQPAAEEECLGQEISGELQAGGWRLSEEQIQFRNTTLIDITPGEDALLARMKPKTRYNIRLAARKGVTVRPGDQADLEMLYRMYAETSIRDGFVIRDETYYRAVWTTFLQSGIAEPLVAEVGEEAVAAVFIFRFAQKAWYLYGMSREAHREKMPNHLLQWEAMRRARAAGCLVYDLWGAPEAYKESDPLWGVYRFKEGLGGILVRHIGAWDFPVHPLLYRIYTQTLPHLMDVMRQRGKAGLRQQFGGS